MPSRRHIHDFTTYFDVLMGAPPHRDVEQGRGMQLTPGTVLAVQPTDGGKAFAVALARVQEGEPEAGE